MTIKKNIDEFLFVALKQGDESAYEMLFKLYYADLCKYAITFLRVAELAEEVVQETFMDIWEKRQEIEIRKSWRAYIFRCVHNKCLSFLARAGRMTRSDIEISEEIISHHKLACLKLDPEVLDKLFTEEMMESFQKALDELPPQCRKIFMLSRDERLSYQEISRKTGISMNTVKTQMKRALKKLRASLEQELQK